MVSIAAVRDDFRNEVKFFSWVFRQLFADINPARLFDYTGKVRKMMGKNFFGFEDWSKALNRSLIVKRISRRTAAQLLKILNSPCPFESNRLVKETHIFFPGVVRVKKEQLTLMWLQRNYPAFFNSTVWYTFQSFANATLEQNVWYLVYQSAVPGSTSLTYQEQERMLPEGYRPTSAIEEVVRFFLTLRCQKNHLWPSSIMARTRDFGLRDGHVCVDRQFLTDRKEIDICVYTEERSNIIGISATRLIKSP